MRPLTSLSTTNTWLRAGFRATHAAMQIGMRQISSETMEWLDTACKVGDLTRTALAREPCEREKWYGRVGSLCLASAREFLPTLAERLDVRLPEAEPVGGTGRVGRDHDRRCRAAHGAVPGRRGDAERHEEDELAEGLGAAPGGTAWQEAQHDRAGRAHGRGASPDVA